MGSKRKRPRTALLICPVLALAAVLSIGCYDLVIMVAAGVLHAPFASLPETGWKEDFERTGRFEFDWFSCPVPKGQFWKFRRDVYSVSCKKSSMGPSPKSFTTTIAMRTKKENYVEPGDFRDFAETFCLGSLDKDKYKIVASSFKLNDRFGPFCVKLDVTAKRIGEPNEDATLRPIIQIYGYICEHPGDPMKFFTLLCREERLPDKQYSGLAKFRMEGKQVLEGVKFTRPSRGKTKASGF